MASEVSIRSSLQIVSGNFRYQSQPTAFIGSVSVARGPTPGLVSISTTGESVSLSELITPGYCRIQNLDATNYVEWGILVSATFYPLGEILAGESYVFRFSRNLGEAETVPGTGTTGPVNTLYLRSNTASCDVVVEAFEA